MNASPDATWDVRHHVFATIADRGTAPNVAETAAALNLPHATVEVALAWLAANAELVLASDGSVIMAHPFSNVPTPFSVTTGGQRWWANCAWDTFGILVALQRDGVIEASYAEDGEPARILVEGGTPIGMGVVHLLLPAREWTKDYFDT
ncbi:MAG: organomercurial lyase [Chloroflexota bacterium]